MEAFRLDPLHGDGWPDAIKRCGAAPDTLKMPAIGAPAGGMAHDFNNLLGIIMVNLELLQRLVRHDTAAGELCAEAIGGANLCADLIASLPAAARQQPLAPQATSSGAGMPTASRLTGGEETVLLVEDNVQLRRAVSRQLAQLGYQVRDSADADSALLILSSAERVDLLFTDLMMPGSMTGLELARQAAEMRPDLPILLTSGFPGWRSDLLYPDGQIPWPVLNKPYSRDKLACALRELLAHG